MTSSNDQFYKGVENSIWRRMSVRRFLDKKIPEDVLKKLVEAAIHAPSGSNFQNQRFLIIQDENEIMRIGKSRLVWPYRNVDLTRIRKKIRGESLAKRLR